MKITQRCISSFYFKICDSFDDIDVWDWVVLFFWYSLVNVITVSLFFNHNLVKSVCVFNLIIFTNCLEMKLAVKKTYIFIYKLYLSWWYLISSSSVMSAIKSKYLLKNFQRFLLSLKEIAASIMQTPTPTVITISLLLYTSMPKSWCTVHTLFDSYTHWLNSSYC